MSDHIPILGFDGFARQHLVRALAEHGEKIIAVSCQPHDLKSASIEPVVGELNKPEHFLPLVVRSSEVVHFPSRSTLGSSAGNVIAELLGNRRPTLALQKALQQELQTDLLYLSSGGSPCSAEPSQLATKSAHVSPRSHHGAGR